MKRIGLWIILILAASILPVAIAAPGSEPEQAAYPDHLAMTPPMGWNSYDSYWADVNEAEVRANAEYMARHLKQFGWKYVVIDYYWYLPHPEQRVSEETEQVTMDRYGRLLPAVNRFPSAAGGKGFKPLADYIHSLGLKFGIHIMRGIPRAAVKENLPVLGTQAHARDIADLRNSCSWSTMMDGVDVSKAAGRAYYNSIAKLYATWGVDFIKADDMSRGENPEGETYHGAEIEALREAMNGAGRPMVLSLSPGPTAIANARSVMQWSQMWRISNDVWDNWSQILQQFDFTRDWAQFDGPNHWPDADMLPLGRIRVRGYRDKSPCKLTHDEQITMMTLWSIFRSPLMMGGDLPSLDPFTLSLLTNPEVLAVDQRSTANHEILRPRNAIIWEARDPASAAKYVAFFNTASEPSHIAVSWRRLGIDGKAVVRDLWRRKDLGNYNGEFEATINPHGAGFYKLTPARVSN